MPQSAQSETATLNALVRLPIVTMSDDAMNGPNPLPRPSSSAYTAKAVPRVSGEFTLSRTARLLPAVTEAKTPARNAAQRAFCGGRLGRVRRNGERLRHG